MQERWIPLALSSNNNQQMGRAGYIYSGGWIFMVVGWIFIVGEGRECGLGAAWREAPHKVAVNIECNWDFNWFIIRILNSRIMGSFRSEPDVNKHTTTGGFQKYQFAVSHMCGWRNYMEDAHMAIAPFSDKKFALFGVFDGHGGAECAVFVERHFSKELLANSNFKQGNYEAALKETFLKMDELLQTEAGRKEIVSIQKQMKDIGNGSSYDEPSHAGCTSNVVLITPEFVYCANAGDSRAVASINGSHVPLSFDHKPQDQIELNRITAAGGVVSYGRVNGNLNLSRALGDLQYKSNLKISPEEQMITANPDIKKFKNEGIDFIIMGCDGIWEVKSNEDMVKWISRRLHDKKESASILEELLDELVSKDSSREYGMDNMSSILITFSK